MSHLSSALAVSPPSSSSSSRASVKSLHGALALDVDDSLQRTFAPNSVPVVNFNPLELPANVSFGHEADGDGNREDEPSAPLQAINYTRTASGTRHQELLLARLAAGAQGASVTSVGSGGAGSSVETGVTNTSQLSALVSPVRKTVHFPPPACSSSSGDVPLLTTWDREKFLSALCCMRLDELPQLLVDVIDVISEHTKPPREFQRNMSSFVPTGSFASQHAYQQHALLPNVSSGSYLAPSPSLHSPQVNSALATPQLHTQRSFAFDPVPATAPGSAVMPPPPPPSSASSFPYPFSGSTVPSPLVSHGRSPFPIQSPQLMRRGHTMAMVDGDGAHGTGTATSVSTMNHETSMTPSSLETSITSLRPTPKTTNIVHQFTDSEGFVCINNYIVLEEIGAGKFGRVCIASLSDDTTEYRAIKIVPKRRLRQRWHQLRQFPVGGSNRSEVISEIQREVAIMKRLRHKHIVHLFEVIDDPEEQNLYLVMKYVERGPIVHLDEQWRCDPLDIDMVRVIIRQAALGVAYLHRHHIAHRDIKPDNILLGKDNNVYLSDFGVSQLFESDNDHILSSDGTPAYAAPEIVMGKGQYSAMKADVWAFGVTMYTILYGVCPFTSPSILELNEHIVTKPIDYSIHAGMNADCDYDDAIDLLQHMLDRNPDTRISAKDICQHPFVATNRKKRNQSSSSPPKKSSTSASLLSKTKSRNDTPKSGEKEGDVAAALNVSTPSLSFTTAPPIAVDGTSSVMSMSPASSVTPSRSPHNSFHPKLVIELPSSDNVHGACRRLSDSDEVSPPSSHSTAPTDLIKKDSDPLTKEDSTDSPEIEPTIQELMASFTPLVARPPVPHLMRRQSAAFRREWVTFE